MPAHTCHLPGCSAPCPPAWLFCRSHWRMVPRPIQQEVYATVKRRGSHVDKTWAPWWRAQARAAEAVLLKLGRSAQDIAPWLERELRFADTLEGR